MTAQFTPDRNGVLMSTGRGSILLSLSQCDRMLGLFEEVGCPASRSMHADLHDAFMAAGGIERGQVFRNREAA